MGELQVRLGRGKSIDDALIEGAVLGLSAEEISERIGRTLSPARVMQKTREMLKDGDWLDENEKERALLRILQQRIVELQSTTELDAIKVQAAMVKDLLVQLNKRRAGLEHDVDRLYQAQARIMSEAIALAFEKALFTLQKRYPQIEEGELRSVLAESLPEAVYVLSAHNSGEVIET